MCALYDGEIVGRSKEGNAITNIPSDIVGNSGHDSAFDGKVCLGDSVELYFPRDLRASKGSQALALFEGKDWLRYGLGYTALCNIPLYDGPYCSFGEPYILSRAGRNLEIALRRCDAMRQLCLNIGDSFSIFLSRSKAFIEKQNAYSVKQLYGRDLFMDDEQYANFRPLPRCVGIFRSASPFDDVYQRRDYVVRCAKQHRIASILDLADTEYQLDQLLEDKIEYVSELRASKNVIAVGDDSGFTSLEFSNAIVDGLRKLIKLPKPWLIHCRAGKRRSGFVCALLEGIAGANLDELIDDYMLSYKFNNGITRENNPCEYRTIMYDTIIKILDHIRLKPELGGPDDLSIINWHDQCLGFLLSHGMPLDEALELERLVTSE